VKTQVEYTYLATTCWCS